MSILFVILYVIIGIFVTASVTVYVAGDFPSEDDQLKAATLGLAIGVTWITSIPVIILILILYSLVVLTKKLLFRN